MKNNNYFFQNYKTKKALEVDIQNLINSYDFNQEFESELLSDLMAEKHYGCLFHGLRPLWFLKKKNKLSYDFFCFITPVGWYPISWRQAIKPETEKSIVEKALRYAIKPYTSGRKRQYRICERCGKAPSEDTDHVEPEFNDIATQAINTLSGKDLKSIMDSYKSNFLNKEPFQLPENNSALIYTLEAHKTAKLQAVCKKCHQLNANERKKS
jgi:hypothetical protein